MRDIQVDLAGLSQVHQDLSRIRYDLDEFDSSYATANADALGHDGVLGAFEGFVYGWTDGRERINEQLVVAGQKIEAAVDAYRHAEHAIGNAAEEMRGGMQ